MIGRALASLGAGTALALAPLAVDARALIVPDCGGGRHLLFVPDVPGGKGEKACAKACHAMTERRGKPLGVRIGCC